MPGGAHGAQHRQQQARVSAMATLVKRGNRWSLVYRVRDGAGRWKVVFRATGCTEEGEARKLLDTFNAAQAGTLKREALRKILDGIGVQAGPEIAVAGLWEYYRGHAEASGSADQVRARENMVRGFCRWCAMTHPEVTQVRDVDERIAAEYWRWMAADGKSPRTRNNIRGQLLVTWRQIQAEAGLASNPWAAVARDQGGGESYRMLELEEIRRIWREAKGFAEPGVEPGFWAWAVVAGLYTGLRLGDLASLEWSELQEREGLLVLLPNKTKRWGRDRWAVHTLDAPWVGALGPIGGRDGFVWPMAARKAGRGGMGLRGFGEICRRAGLATEGPQEAGVRRKRAVKLVTFHSLRHSFVTHLLRTGKVTEVDLVRQGNWSSVEVVSSVYNSAKWEQATAAAAKVAAAMPEVKWE